MAKKIRSAPKKGGAYPLDDIWCRDSECPVPDILGGFDAGYEENRAFAERVSGSDLEYDSKKFIFTYQAYLKPHIAKLAKDAKSLNRAVYSRSKDPNDYLDLALADYIDYELSVDKTQTVCQILDEPSAKGQKSFERESEKLTMRMYDAASNMSPRYLFYAMRLGKLISLSDNPKKCLLPLEIMALDIDEMPAGRMRNEAKWIYNDTVEGIDAGRLSRDETKSLMEYALRVMEGDSAPILRKLAKSGAIPYTRMHKAVVDPDIPSNPKLLENLVERNIIIRTKDGGYKIPLVEPGDESAYGYEGGRSIMSVPTSEKDEFIVVFKGVGSRLGHDKNSFRFQPESSYSVHQFHGGLLAEDALPCVKTPVELRKTYQKMLGKKDESVVLAGEYGMGEDFIYDPVAAFIPMTLPVRKGGSVGTVSVRRGTGLKLSGFPRGWSGEQRVLAYVAHPAKRLRDISDIHLEPHDWDGAFGHFGYELIKRGRWVKPEVRNEMGREVPYEMAAMKVLNRAAAGYALFNHVLHNGLGGASCVDANNAGVFQIEGNGRFHNIDPQGATYDPDTIWWPGDGYRYSKESFKKHMTLDDGRDYVLIDHYQGIDDSGALLAINEVAHKLGLGTKHLEKAYYVYSKIYRPPETFKNMRLY